MPKLGVILNPLAKSFRANPELAERMAFIVGESSPFSSPKSSQQLFEVLQQFKERGVEVLAVSGGDGTMHKVFEALDSIYKLDPWPKFAILRGGTLNAMASSFGISGDPMTLLSQLILAVHGQKNWTTVPFQLMRVNKHLGAVFGLGLVFDFMDEYYKSKRRGHSMAFLTLLKMTWQYLWTKKLYPNIQASLVINQTQKFQTAVHSLLVGSIKQLALKCRLFYFVKENQLHVLAASGVIFNVLKRLPWVWFGKNFSQNGIWQAPVTDLNIQLVSKQAYTIDGDLYPPVGEFCISLGPVVQLVKIHS